MRLLRLVDRLEAPGKLLSHLVVPAVIVLHFVLLNSRAPEAAPTLVAGVAAGLGYVLMTISVIGGHRNRPAATGAAFLLVVMAVLSVAGLHGSAPLLEVEGPSQPDGFFARSVLAIGCFAAFYLVHRVYYPEHVGVRWDDLRSSWPVIFLVGVGLALFAPTAEPVFGIAKIALFSSIALLLLPAAVRRPREVAPLLIGAVLYSGATLAGYAEWFYSFGSETGAALGMMFLGLAIAFDLADNYLRTHEESARKTEELQSARRLQLSLLPPTAPKLPIAEVAWQMQTATEVGGDYYDYSLSDDGVLTVCIGDATGHGMDSGLVVTGTKSLFKTFADASGMTDSLTVMSKSLRSMNLPRMGMAITLLRIDRRACTVATAGMPPVMVYRVMSREIEEVVIAGYPLGLSARPEYEQVVLELSRGDVILMMSDGLPERLNPHDEYFDYDRTKAAFARVAAMTPAEICQEMLRSSEEWADGRPQDDDITIVVLRAK